MDFCKLCAYTEKHDLNEDAKGFPANVTGAGYEASFELALYCHLIHGHGRVARQILQYNVPYNYCPECGRRISQQCAK